MAALGVMSPGDSLVLGVGVGIIAGPRLAAPVTGLSAPAVADPTFAVETATALLARMS